MSFCDNDDLCSRNFPTPHCKEAMWKNYHLKFRTSSKFLQIKTILYVGILNSLSRNETESSAVLAGLQSPDPKPSLQG